jgi:hypothetical protein
MLRSFGVLRVHTSLSVNQVDRSGNCLDLICHVGSGLTLSGHCGYEPRDGESNPWLSVVEFLTDRCQRRDRFSFYICQ